MPIEKLAEMHAGQICLWGEIDRQWTLTYGSTDDARAAVRRVARAFLRDKRTGVVGYCAGGKGHKLENLDAVYNEWGTI
ncbi:MAG: hypothetical protein SFY80_04630 [Verrucomicrobiota bacterium]|nr:hypothetical protein [Verrucomicrobiota bacterium]